MRTPLISLIVLLLAGCATLETAEARMARNRENLLNLRIGMEKSEAMDVMGRPDLRESYQSSYDKSVEILYYFTNKKDFDNNIAKDECTPLLFENGTLVWLGKSVP